jgi:hypothetical protein
MKIEHLALGLIPALSCGAALTKTDPGNGNIVWRRGEQRTLIDFRSTHPQRKAILVSHKGFPKEIPTYSIHLVDGEISEVNEWPEAKECSYRTVDLDGDSKADLFEILGSGAEILEAYVLVDGTLEPKEKLE